MTTEEILERIDSHEDPNLMETLDLKSRGIWECALQLSIIASKLPDSDAGSLAELKNMNDQLDGELFNLKERYGMLIKSVKTAREWIDVASMQTTPASIYESLRKAKNCLEPK